MTNKRQPNQADLIRLVQALSMYGVEYIVIGGAAMALHGFPRMTKDIDLLLPVDPSNNQKLLRALECIPNGKEALEQLRLQWMDNGHSTAVEGEISIDLLYVAAEKSFDYLSQYIKIVTVNGTPIATLDVDGMLISKDTTREEDIPDRLKLGRLKNAQIEIEKNARIAALPNLSDASGAICTFWKNADSAIKQAGGDVGKVSWGKVEELAIREWIVDQGQSCESIIDALCIHSPGAVSIKKREALEGDVMGPK